MDDLLTHDMDYCITQYEDRRNNGHRTVVSNDNGMYEHFDSYGNRPDQSIEWVNMQMRRRLNESTPYLTNLLKDKQYIDNTVKYQDRDGYVNTCG